MAVDTRSIQRREDLHSMELVEGAGRNPWTECRLSTRSRTTTAGILREALRGSQRHKQQHEWCGDIISIIFYPRTRVDVLLEMPTGTTSPVPPLLHVPTMHLAIRPPLCLGQPMHWIQQLSQFFSDAVVLHSRMLVRRGNALRSILGTTAPTSAISRRVVGIPEGQLFHVDSSATGTSETGLGK